jgi:hypothetical protein
MQNKSSIAIAIFMLSTMVGCAAPLQTPSGRPEVTFARATREQIRDAMINKFVANGCTISQDTPSTLVFSKPWNNAGGVMYQVLEGNSYSYTPQAELAITMANTQEGIRVFANCSVEMRNAFGGSDRQDMTQGQTAQQLQSFLEQVKLSLESNPPPPSRQPIATAAGMR